MDCSVDGCRVPSRSKGMCNQHYQRVIRTGRPELKSFEQVFMSRVDKSGTCWNWLGKTTWNGYGTIDYLRKRIYVHRASYEMYVGEIPDGLQIDHLCRNRCCVRPDHLEPVTCAENIHRGYGPSGVNHKKTCCVRGHPFAGENLRTNDKGHRTCLECEKTKRLRRTRG